MCIHTKTDNTWGRSSSLVGPTVAGCREACSSSFLEEFFCETQLTLRAKKVDRQMLKHAGSREALPTL